MEGMQFNGYSAAGTSSGQDAQRPVSGRSMVPSFFKCPSCGVTQLREGEFCAYCGKPAPEDPTPPAPDQDQGEAADGDMSVCPACGSRQKSGMKFCSNCGHLMEDRLPPEERVCPSCGTKASESALFCMECGMRL